MSTVRMDGTNVYKGLENQYNDGKDMMKEISARRDEIKNDPNMSAADKKEALGMLDKAEKDVRMALDFTTQGSKWDTNTGSIAGDKDMSAILGRLDAAMA